MSATRRLRAGPLEAAFRSGELWHVRIGEFEIAQRIYVAVRDHNWGTAPGGVENVEIAERPDGFRVAFECIHQQDAVDFRWRGTITAEASGSLTFAMDGRAHARFLRNRIGFCVHHPLRECAGARCTVETPDGRARRTRFPDDVRPHQPFVGVRAIRQTIAPGVRAEIRFLGDVFETEDHRNWTDANFKTYGTPLGLPFPLEVKVGDEVRQQIEITWRGAVESAGPAAAGAVHLRLGPKLGKLPAIGMGLGRALSETERDALRRLRLSHLRVDLPGSVERAVDEARAIGARLQAAVTLPCDIGSIDEWAPFVDRWLVYSSQRKASGAAEALLMRAAVGPRASVVVGTNAYFAELNRNRPGKGAWDAACFPVTPQVHAFDDESVMANAAAQFDAVRTARRFLKDRPVVVSPVTLRPRFNPDATSAAIVTPAPDPRQQLPFCAAWTVASLKALSEAGAASVTYYEAVGAGGVMDGELLYPVFAVFEAVGDFAGASVLRCESSDPARIAALALRSAAIQRTIVANLTPAPCSFVWGEVRTLQPYAVSVMDQEVN